MQKKVITLAEIMRNAGVPLLAEPVADMLIRHTCIRKVEPEWSSEVQRFLHLRIYPGEANRSDNHAIRWRQMAAAVPWKYGHASPVEDLAMVTNTFATLRLDRTSRAYLNSHTLRQLSKRQNCERLGMWADSDLAITEINAWFWMRNFPEFHLGTLPDDLVVLVGSVPEGRQAIEVRPSTISPRRCTDVCAHDLFVIEYPAVVVLNVGDVW